MRKDLYEFLLKFGCGVLLIALCVHLLALSYGLPSVGTIGAAVGSQWRDGSLSHDILVSAARWLSGWAIGASLGVMLGLLTGRVRVGSLTFEGFLILCRAIPFISLYPLFMRMYGLDERGKIYLVAWASAGMSWIVVHQAAKALPPSLVWRAKSLGVSRPIRLFRILLPSCGVGIYSGLRAALGLAWIVIAVAEMGGVYERSAGLWWSEGLGYRLFRSKDQSRDDLMMAAIAAFAVVGIAADAAFAVAWSSVVSALFRLRQRRVQRIVASLARQPAATSLDWQPPVSLEVADIHAGYDGREVIHGMSFCIPPGATMSIVGPSGCGKTTLIRAIGHFTDTVFHVSGTVTAGTPRAKAGSWAAVVLQDSPVFERLTVWDNLTIGQRFRRRDPQAFSEAWNLLVQFGLSDAASARAGTLSGGQRQRLALATALANRPLVLLLDEPFGALDAITRHQLRRFYWEHIHGRVTAIFVTHDLEESLLVGDIVRVGVAADSPTLTVDRRDVPVLQWEFHEDFARLKADLVRALYQEAACAEERSTARRPL